MFLIEADGKRLLYTGDFRLHGVRGNVMDKILDRRIGTVDVVVTEGTTVSRSEHEVVTEWDLQKRVKAYLRQYKYVFVLCATTNLDRIFALARAVPRGKYCICDDYQKIGAGSRLFMRCRNFYPSNTTHRRVLRSWAD